MDMDQVKQTFIVECRELLSAMEEALLAVEGEAEASESINAIFRAVHTIKGSAGLFGLDPIVRFSHTVESVMDRVRGGKVALSPDLVGLFLECHDHLVRLIGTVQENVPEPPEIAEAGEGLLLALVPFLEGAVATREVTEVHPEVRAREEGGRSHWHLSVRFPPDCLQNGMDPLSFVRYLRTLGTMVHLHALFEKLPQGEAFDPEVCYLGLEMDLDTDADRRTLEDVFEFIRDEALIHIVPPDAKVDAYLALIRDLPEEERLLGEILVAGGCVTAHELEASLSAQKRPEEERRIGAILVEEHAVPPPVVAAALEKQKRFQEKQAGELKVVKVAADKLDKLVDLVGELVIAGASAHARAASSHDAGMVEATAHFNKLVEEIRDNALSLRMVQIGDTFNRFRRIVRDVSRELGKEIELEIQGAETELDKSIVEKIGDPLMHIVRNSIDHGIESTEVRRARGKAEVGSLGLNAYHESGSIVIEVADDGGGLDRARILAKAVEKGLVAEGAQLTDAEITGLIFEPGFSTASQVSNLSGRGVGMDVVRRNIDELRGTVEVESYEGSGTTLRIRLPLTLAIIDGFRVEVAGTCYVLPMDAVIECLDLGPFLESEENHLINLRGEVLPFLRLREVFSLSGEAPAKERVVVVQFGEIRAGIVVDRLLGEFQTVIKPLGELFRNLKGVGGSTILGTGEVALILDVAALIHLAVERRGGGRMTAKSGGVLAGR
jgi:two-component system, chemotaxis family, sensor kinase CheA